MWAPQSPLLRRVYIRDADGHSALVSTRALQELQRSTPDACEAYVARGLVQGCVVYQEAANAVAKLLPPLRVQQRIAAVEHMQRQLLDHGPLGIGSRGSGWRMWRRTVACTRPTAWAPSPPRPQGPCLGPGQGQARDPRQKSRRPPVTPVQTPTPPAGLCLWCGCACSWSRRSGRRCWRARRSVCSRSFGWTR